MISGLLEPHLLGLKTNLEIEGRLKIRLDCALVTNDWILKFQGVNVNHVAISNLDYSLLALRINNYNVAQPRTNQSIILFEEM